MNNMAIYVYDLRTLMTQPFVVVYDESHVSLVLKALSGDDNPSWAFVSRIRLHKYEPIDPYKPVKKK